MSVSLAAIAALGSVASAGLGAGMSAAANDEARARLAADQEADRRYYDRLLSRDYVESSENQLLLRKLREMQRDNYNRARATNVVAGGTESHLASMQQAGNKVVSDTAGGIAARSDAYKDRVRAAKRGAEKAYSQQMFGLDMQRSQNIANAASQATAAFAGIAGGAGGAENPYGETTEQEYVRHEANPQDPHTKPTIVAGDKQAAIDRTIDILSTAQALGVDPSVFGIGATALMGMKKNQK